MGRREAEPAVVVEVVGAGDGIVDPDAVVPEPLPEEAAGLEGEEGDGELGARSGEQ